MRLMKHRNIAIVLVAAFAATVVAQVEAQSTTAGADTVTYLASRFKMADSESAPEQRSNEKTTSVLLGADPLVSQLTFPPQPKRGDSVLNGVLIGAGIGAILGLIPDHYDDCEECHDSLYGSIAVGAGIGLIVDLLRHPKPTASSSPVDERVRVHLALGRGVVGLGGRIAWR